MTVPDLPAALLPSIKSFLVFGCTYLLFNFKLKPKYHFANSDYHMCANALFLHTQTELAWLDHILDVESMHYRLVVWGGEGGASSFASKHFLHKTFCLLKRL